ncbi:MAG: VWA domain-containing protein [Candidatus Limnocylindria bacterium]
MIAPLALIGLIALPIIVAFYMLRLRRRDVPVGSTFLWQQLIRDLEANAPWQRLRFSWLLLVQLLIALIVVLAAVRPFSIVESDLAANVVLIVDTSASMGARDAAGERIELARDAARGVIERLPEGGRVTVVAADDTAHVLASETDDTAAALDAIDRITASQLPGDLTDAFALASALAARDADSTVVVVTDAGADRLPPVGIGAPVQVERVGETDANQAVAALAGLRRSGGAQVDLFVAVSNPSGADATRRLEIYADGELVDARDLRVPAGQRSEALISNVPPSATVIEARLAGADALGVDDRAFALLPAEERVRALLVTDGNAYLESALALLPRLELYAVREAGYLDALAEAETDGTPYGLLVFDGVVPEEAPSIPALYLDPGADGAFGTIGGRIESPIIARADPDEPLLRFVDLTTVHIGRARNAALAEGMAPVVESTDGEPLVAAGQVAGRRLALIAFALAESDLPLQVAFPLLTSNLVDYLLPPAGGVLPAATALGEPIQLALDPSLESVTLVADGVESTVQLTGGRGTLPGATRVGIRELRDPDGAVLGRVAANLFSADESDVAPGDPQRIIDMGRFASTDDEPGQSARSEWWWPLALAAMGLLAIEWLLFHRPTQRSLRRLLGASRASQSVAGRAR